MSVRACVCVCLCAWCVSVSVCLPVCRLSELVVLVHDGMHSELDMSDVERCEFGGRLKSAVFNFTNDLIPHMKEEEEVV